MNGFGHDPLATLDSDSELPPYLLELFLRAAPEQMADLVAKCERRELEAARAQAHKLKGGLYAAGASRLADRLESLRGSLTRADWTSALQELARIRAALQLDEHPRERRGRGQG